MPTKQTQKGFYAVRTGRKAGVFETWSDCEEQVKGFPKARYKKFKTFEEAEYFALGVLPPELSNADASTSNWEPSLVVSNTRKRSRSLDESEWDVVYSDGACKGNGKVGSIAGIGVWWGPDDSRNLAERCPGDQTNNRAELIAILRVLETAPASTKPLLIKTDSQYSIDCLKTWILKWKKNGFLSARGEAVKNAGIIRCASIQLNIRASYPQKIRLQYVKGHSGDVGNDGADAMANRGTLLPAVEERDWEALEMKLSEQLEKRSVETNGVEPVPMEVQDVDDVMEDSVVEIPSSKMGKMSSDFHEHNTTTAIATLSPFKPAPDSIASEALSWASSRSTSNLLPLLSAPQEKTGVAAASPAQYSALPASARPQDISLESPATVSSMDFETIRDKVSPKVIYASICASEVDPDDYADCLLDDGDLAGELSD